MFNIDRIATVNRAVKIQTPILVPIQFSIYNRLTSLLGSNSTTVRRVYALRTGAFAVDVLPNVSVPVSEARSKFDDRSRKHQCGFPIVGFRNLHLLLFPPVIVFVELGKLVSILSESCRCLYLAQRNKKKKFEFVVGNCSANSVIPLHNLFNVITLYLLVINPALSVSSNQDTSVYSIYPLRIHYRDKMFSL